MYKAAHWFVVNMLLSHEGDNMADPLAHLQEQLRKDQKLLDTIKAHLPELEQLVAMLEYDYSLPDTFFLLNEHMESHRNP